MADEADSGTEQQQYPITNKIKKTTDTDPADNDNDKVTASSNLNYDSNDGVSSPLLRCERCDKFETHSHSILLLHTVQCATQQVAAAAAVAAAAVAAASTTSTTTTGIGIVTGGTGKTIPSSAAGGSSSSIHLHNNNNIVTATNAKHQNNENTAVVGVAGSGGGDIETGGSSDMHENSMGSTATNPDNSDTNKSQTQNSNRKLFECDVCNMKFSNGANMRRHKMRHTGVKPYECRVCQKRFFRKDHLAEHFTTHTKTLPYHCPICNRGFQRQIAMRAHFQNEHVGQHDLVKTCPLCSYRAGTMKSLRVHFFNRHGIDLDNPGPGAPSSLLLALDPQNTGQYLPQNLSAATTCVPTYSDSGDSIRSTENVTPPMHFLTPHVEISMAENVDSFSTDTAGGISKNHHPSLDIKLSNGPNGISPSSPQSIDSNSNVPSSSHTTLTSLVQSPRGNQNEGHITPSISLIPIKQEPSNDDYFSDKNNISNSGDHLASSSGVGNSLDSAIPTSSLTSLIKVSPLKSLLREDLKRRICARANTRAARNLNNNLALANSYLTATNLSSSAVAISAAAAAGSNGCNASGSSLSSGSNMHAEIVATNIGGGGSSCGNIVITNSATTTSATNGIITSTGGQETDLTSIGGSGGNNGSSVAGGISGGRIIYNKKYLQCLFCGIEFPDQTLYFLHKGCHSESNPWKCNICGEQCNNVYEFNSHLLSKSHQ